LPRPLLRFLFTDLLAREVRWFSPGLAHRFLLPPLPFFFSWPPGLRGRPYPDGSLAGFRRRDGPKQLRARIPCAIGPAVHFPQARRNWPPPWAQSFENTEAAGEPPCLAALVPPGRNWLVGRSSFCLSQFPRKLSVCQLSHRYILQAYFAGKNNPPFRSGMGQKLCPPRQGPRNGNGPLAPGGPFGQRLVPISLKQKTLISPGRRKITATKTHLLRPGPGPYLLPHSGFFSPGRLLRKSVLSGKHRARDPRNLLGTQTQGLMENAFHGRYGRAFKFSARFRKSQPA